MEKVVVVTGGGQGIGKAIAKAFMAAGSQVALAELDEVAGEETAAELGALFIPCDVSRREDVQRMTAEVRKRFGRLDVLVNNAGTGMDLATPLEQLPEEAWDRILGINLKGAFLCAAATARLLKENNGAIVNIASTRALMSEPHNEAYAASKGGLVALTHSLAVSLGPFVRVNCISPGWIETSEWKKKAKRHHALLTQEDHGQHPAGRVGKPEDVAELAVWLASPAAAFVTGANFVVDGGMTRKMIYV